MKKREIFIKLLSSIILIIIAYTYILPSISLGADIKQELKTGIDNFPDSYQEKLKKLKELHPNWNFQAYYTGIDWNELIKNETGEVLHKRSVVPSDSPDLWKCNMCEDDKGWTCASKEIVEYFIDPRNFLNEVNIFQFEELSFNKDIHTSEGVQIAVKNTFLDNSITYYDEEKKQNVTRTYTDIIMEVAQKTNISPFHIKSKIIQEVGAQGSPSVSGTYPGYENYYNFFNYGSHDTGDPIVNGLSFAKEKGWNNPYKAILGGAELIGTTYVNQGQNTSYFFKYDVVGDKILKVNETSTISDSSLYAHQYMTNIMDPYSQSSSVYNAYVKNGNIDATLNFIIPVYENMEECYKKPTKYTIKDGELYYADIIKETGARDDVKFDSPVVYSIQKDEIVIMINRKCVFSDGIYWDLVMLENGWNVYVESSDMKPYRSDEMEKQDETVIIDEERNTITVTPPVEMKKVIDELKISNYSIIDSSGKEVTGDNKKVCTGYKLNILKEDNKTLKKEYTLIKVGDVNGDGNLLATDSLAILKHSIEERKLEEVYLEAADVRKDGKINSVDALLVLKYSLGKVSINI